MMMIIMVVLVIKDMNDDKNAYNDTDRKNSDQTWRKRNNIT